MRLRLAVLFLMIFCGTLSVQAQTTQAKPPSGFFPEARFSGSFEKYHADDIYTRFFSWDARMGIGLTIVRIGNHSVFFKTEFQTVGAQKTGNKINIAGTSYILEGGYSYVLPLGIKASIGMNHLSSHLTEDLIKLVAQERMKGHKIPEITASDLNVFFGEFEKDFSNVPLRPHFRLRLQPIGFRFHGKSYHYERPVYFTAEVTPWHGHEKRIVIATQHEWGYNHFNDYTLRLELAARNQSEGRFQVFIAGSPGSNLHVGPNDGYHRDGLRMGIRLVFQAH